YLLAAGADLSLTPGGDTGLAAELTRLARLRLDIGAAPRLEGGALIGPALHSSAPPLRSPAPSLQNRAGPTPGDYFCLATAFICFLKARTSSSVSPSTISAAERRDPGSA